MMKRSRREEKKEKEKEVEALGTNRRLLLSEGDESCLSSRMEECLAPTVEG